MWLPRCQLSSTVVASQIFIRKADYYLILRLRWAKTTQKVCVFTTIVFKVEKIKIIITYKNYFPHEIGVL